MSTTFTPTELQTIHNTKFFTVKASATKKIEHLFATIRDTIKEEIKKRNIVFPSEVDSVNGKIFRGENYLGLPYLVLDYPKHFSKNSILAFRTMFWWGNFFSFTMHLQGKALEEWRKKLTLKPIPAFPEGRGLEMQRSPFGGEKERRLLYICINNNPWQYHYQKDNYLPVNKLSESELRKLLLEKEFVKLSMHIPIRDHKKLVKFVRDSFLHLCPER